MLRHGRNLWKSENPYSKNKTYTGPGKVTAPKWLSNDRVERASWEHDGDYTEVPWLSWNNNAYTRYNEADAKWQKTLKGDRSIVGLFGQELWKYKALATGGRSYVVPTEVAVPRVPESLRPPTMSGVGSKRPRFAQGPVYRFGGSNFRRLTRGGGIKKPRQALHTKFHSKMCIEKKFHDATSGVVTSSTSGTGMKFSVISGIAQGTSSIQRVGRRIFGWDLFLKGYVQLTETADLPSAGVEMRVLVVKDRQSNGNTPDIDEILDVGATVTHKPFAFRNLENTRRFEIMYDHTFVINAKATVQTDGAGANSTMENKIPFHFSKKWKDGLKIIYQTGEGGGLSNTIQDNNVWVIAYAQNTSGEIVVNSRFRYTD